MASDICATAGKQELQVSVEADQSQWRIKIDDREYLVDAVRVKRGTWSLLLNGRSILVDVNESKEPFEFHTHRAVTPILIENAQQKRLAEQLNRAGGKKKRDEVIQAAIAGRVVKIQVEVGQQVEAGTCVAILEAMKMENEIKCVSAGMVQSISVAAGDSVDTGATLLVIKAPSVENISTEAPSTEVEA